MICSSILAIHALTDEKDLQGDKTKGEDTLYTGSYTADRGFEDFNDKEYIFGGIALERDKGNGLTVTYELTVNSGKQLIQTSQTVLA